VKRRLGCSAGRCEAFEFLPKKINQSKCIVWDLNALKNSGLFLFT